MASHQLAIAKASFSAGLLRPDPVSVPRDEISHFHALVNSAATQCSRTNIQNCKRWILRNVSQSSARFTAFGKYLIALSTSFTGPATSSTSTTSQREPSAKRKRLHLLYLINDLLHHAKFYANDPSIASKVQPLLVGLLSSAASFRNSPKHYGKIEGLLNIWENKNYYSLEYIDKLREAAKIAHEAEQSTNTSDLLNQNGLAPSEPKAVRSTPFVMPAIHGDQGTPWYDLPAGNLLPHITPNSTRPINPALVKPLRFVAGPAEEDLAREVKNLLQEVQNIYGISQLQYQDEDISWDIDELGQPIFYNDTSGESLSREGYYGWSKTFCENMKRRRSGLGHGWVGSHNERQGRSQSPSRSQSSVPSSPRYKRRRYSISDEERSRSRSKSRPKRSPRADSSSRSSSRERNISLQRDKQPRTSRESRSRSLSQNRNGRDTGGNAYSHSRRTSPEMKLLDTTHDAVRELPRSSIPYGQDFQPTPPPPPPQNFLPSSSHHFGSGVIPIPPPPPPQYQGQWPPHLSNPPITPYAQQAQTGGLWPPPPPPYIQQWPPVSASHGQTPSGQNPWLPLPQQGGNGRGSYGGRGRDGGPGNSQLHYQGAGSGYNGYRGNGRGNGWS